MWVTKINMMGEKFMVNLNIIILAGGSLLIKFLLSLNQVITNLERAEKLIGSLSVPKRIYIKN
jgi:hypothetical protein